MTDEIIRTFSNYEFFPRFSTSVPDRLIEVYGIVLAIRKASTIFVTESHFRDLLLKKEISNVEESLRFLEAIVSGILLKRLLVMPNIKQTYSILPFFLQGGNS